jgi:hypothetical protein
MQVGRSMYLVEAARQYGLLKGSRLSGSGGQLLSK